MAGGDWNIFHVFIDWDIGNVIIPTDFHIFQRGRAQPPTRERSSRRVGMGKGKGVASGERSELERSTKSNGKTHKLSTGPFSSS